MTTSKKLLKPLIRGRSCDSLGIFFFVRREFVVATQMSFLSIFSPKEMIQFLTTVFFFNNGLKPPVRVDG